jgi:DNA-binding transcriptional regulator YiaG
MLENNFVRSVRFKLKLSRKQLAELVGVSWRTVEGWENKRPPGKLARKIIETLIK